MLNGVAAPRFQDAVEPTADQIAADQASLREYQRSRGYTVPQGVAEAEGLTDDENGWINLNSNNPHVAFLPGDAVLDGPTQVYEVTPTHENRITSLVLGSQTCALDTEGNLLPL
jgi:hypothetical protein